MLTRRFVVSGHVQGVGFRNYVQAVAEDLGIHGAVWNRSDGCVELIATDDSDATLKILEALLHQGPGRVDGVIQEEAPPHDYFGFGIEVSR